MAEGDDAERTESPTQRRLDKAREEGQVPRSRDLSAAAVTLAGGIGLYLLGRVMTGRLLMVLHDSLSFSRADAFDQGRIFVVMGRAAMSAVLAVAPLFGVLLSAAVLAPLAIGGWTFSPAALAPKWERLDPISGFGRVFSIRGALELLKSLARFSVIAVIAIVLLRHQMNEFNSLATQPINTGIAHAFALCGFALIALGGGLVVIAAVDVPLTLWQHHRQLRMSREEIREENKETEGNPEIRGRVRRVQQAMARRRMMQEVKKADVIVTNPTHYAVALRYDEKHMRAPVVVAKGADLVALRIRELGEEHGVPTVEAPPVARALFAHCELGDEIPAQLYSAVAQVLTYVYQLRTARRYGATPPPPPDIKAPEA
jgi:flagellar biosynthetic protein FlhB